MKYEGECNKSIVYFTISLVNISQVSNLISICLLFPRTGVQQRLHMQNGGFLSTFFYIWSTRKLEASHDKLKH